MGPRILLLQRLFVRGGRPTAHVSASATKSCKRLAGPYEEVSWLTIPQINVSAGPAPSTDLRLPVTGGECY